MRHSILLADTNLSWEILGISALCFIVSLFIFYYVMKAAVKNGFIEANNSLHFMKKSSESNSDSSNMTLTFEQRSLQQQYEKGEITFEEYKSKWNK